MVPTSARVRRPIGMGGVVDKPIPVIGQPINMPKSDTEDTKEHAPFVEEPIEPAPVLKRGQMVDWWDDIVDIGLKPYPGIVQGVSPGNPGCYSVNVFMNGLLGFKPACPASAKARKFCVTPLE